MLCARFEYDNDVVVLAIDDQLTPPFDDISHLITDPVCPESVMVPELAPGQVYVETGERVPPTDAGATVIEPFRNCTHGPVVVMV